MNGPRSLNGKKWGDQKEIKAWKKQDKSFVKDIDEALVFLERYLKDEYEGATGEEGSKDLHSFFKILADHIEEWWD